MEIVADDQTAKGLSTTEKRVNGTLARISSGFVRTSSTGGSLTTTVGGITGGFARLGAAAGPAGIATAAAFGGALLAANKLVETIQRGAEVIRNLSAEAAKAGVSIEQLTGGRITGADVERIKLMDSAAKELKRSIDLVAASIASEFAPAVTRLATAMNLGVNVAASYGAQLSSLIGLAGALAGQLGFVARMIGVVGSAIGASGIGEDLDELAEQTREIAEQEAKIAQMQSALAQARKTREDFFKGLERARDTVGATTEQKAAFAAADAGVKDEEGVRRAVALAVETERRQKAAQAVADAETKAARAAEAAKAAIEQTNKQFADTLKSLQLEFELMGKSAAERAYALAIDRGMSVEQAKQLAAQTALNEKKKELLAATEKQAEAERMAAEEAKKASDAIFEGQRKNSQEADDFAKTVKESLKTRAEKIRELQEKFQEAVDSGRLSQDEAARGFAKQAESIAGVIKASLESKGNFASSAGALLALQAGGISRTDPLVDLNKKQLATQRQIADNTARGGVFVG